MKEFISRLSSRKFLLAVVAAIVAFGNAYYDWGLETEDVLAFVAPIIAFISVEGWKDSKVAQIRAKEQRDLA